MKLCDDHTIRCTLYQPCIVLYAQNRTSHTYWYQVWCIFPNLKLANYKLITLFFRCELDLEPPIHCGWVHFCWSVLIAALLIVCITLNKATLLAISGLPFHPPLSHKAWPALYSYAPTPSAKSHWQLTPLVLVLQWMLSCVCIPITSREEKTAVSEIIDQASLTSM